jgi:hypothetical protein
MHGGRSQIRVGAQASPDVRFAPKATELLQWHGMTRGAMSGRRTFANAGCPPRISKRIDIHASQSGKALAYRFGAQQVGIEAARGNCSA